MHELWPGKSKWEWKSKGVPIAASAVGTQVPDVYLARPSLPTAPAVISHSKCESKSKGVTIAASAVGTQAPAVYLAPS